MYCISLQGSASVAGHETSYHWIVWIRTPLAIQADHKPRHCRVKLIHCWRTTLTSFTYHHVDQNKSISSE